MKKKRKTPIPLIIASVIFGIYGFSLAVPVVWGLIMSLKDPYEYLTDQLRFPNPPVFANYAQAFVELEHQGTGLGFMIVNSLWTSILGTIIPVFACATAGYVCAKYKYKLCRIWYWIALGTMLIPIFGSMASSIKLSMTLGLFDNPFQYITGYSALGSNFIIFFAFSKGVDWGYAESAFIDGAGHGRVFFQIMLPQLTSPMIALGLTIFINCWGDAQGPLIYLPSYPTLASGFYEYQQRMGGNANYPVLFAGLLMSAIPIIILYVTFQDKLMSLDMSGGLKG